VFIGTNIRITETLFWENAYIRYDIFVNCNWLASRWH